MNSVERIRSLENAEVVAQTEDAWGPSGKLSVSCVETAGDDLRFDLLVPTGRSDIWDYIWSSEKQQGATEKVQLFQSEERIVGSAITAIAREGEDERWDAPGPEQYRLSFSVPASSLRTEVPIEVRFFWSEELMSTAIGS